jgi:hypothetical protein
MASLSAAFGCEKDSSVGSGLFPSPNQAFPFPFSLFKRGNAIIPYSYSLSHSSDFTLQSSISITFTF